MTSQRSASSSLPPSSGSTERVAALEAFILPPSPRPLRQTSGKVFYVGTDPLELPSNVERIGRGEEEEEEVGEETTKDLGLCLEMDVRLSSEHTDGPSKLTVKFRSMVQTIEASPTPVLPPLSPEPVSTPMPSVEQKIAFLSSLANWILWRPSGTPAQQRQLPRITPPLNLWLHLTLPLDTQLLPESPLHFALYGHAGVCMDSLRVTRCLASTISSLSWPPNNTLNLTQPTSPVLLLSPSHGDSAPSSSPTYHPLLTGAFFFACLLIILITLLIVIFVTSIACGRRRRVRKRGRAVTGSVEKGGGDGGPVTLTGAELLRSPSISSLPGAAVHQRPIEEILHCVDEVTAPIINRRLYDKSPKAGLSSIHRHTDGLITALGVNSRRAETFHSVAQHLPFLKRHLGAFFLFQLIISHLIEKLPCRLSLSGVLKRLHFARERFSVGGDSLWMQLTPDLAPLLE